MHPIVLEDLAKFRQQELLKEAESWQLASQAMGKKTDKMGLIRRIINNVVQRRINIHLFQDPKFSHSETLSPRS